MTGVSEFARPFAPRWNYYQCVACRRVVVTVAIERGDYPPTLRCKSLPGHPPECVGVMAQNTERRLADWPMRAKRNPDAEWYRPDSPAELRKIKRAAPKLHAYLMRGGLMLRSPTGRHRWPDSSERPLDLPVMTPHGIAASAVIPTIGERACPYDGNALDANGCCPIHGNPDDDEGDDAD